MNTYLAIALVVGVYGLASYGMGWLTGRTREALRRPGWWPTFLCLYAPLAALTFWLLPSSSHYQGAAIFAASGVAGLIAQWRLGKPKSMV